MADENIIVNKTGSIFLGGPPLVKAATGNIFFYHFSSLSIFVKKKKKVRLFLLKIWVEQNYTVQ